MLPSQGTTSRHASQRAGATLGLLSECPRLRPGPVWPVELRGPSTGGWHCSPRTPAGLQPHTAAPACPPHPGPWLPWADHWACMELPCFYQSRGSQWPRSPGGCVTPASGSINCCCEDVEVKGCALDWPVLLYILSPLSFRWELPLRGGVM